MSSEAVLISADTINSAVHFASSAGIGLGASAAAYLVAELLAQRRCKLEAQLKEASRRVEAWCEYQALQQAEMTEINKIHANSRQALAQLQMTDTFSHSDDEQVKATSFMRKANANEALLLLQKMQQTLEHLPDSLKTDPQTPFPRLLQQIQTLTQQIDSPTPPTVEFLNQLTQTVEKTLEAHLQALAKATAQKEELLTEIETLLNEVIAYQEVAQPIELAELEALQLHLSQRLQANDINLAQLQLFRKKFTRLQQKIEAQLQQAAFREALNQSVHAHLANMGYQPVGQEKDNPYHSLWSIPGGEQVAIHLHENQQIACQMRHERQVDNAETLSEQELAFFRYQEKQWCTDLRELIQRLIKDGFNYQLHFLRDSDINNIPIVVLETAEDILTAQQRQTRPKKQHLP